MVNYCIGHNGNEIEATQPFRTELIGSSIYI